MVQSGRICSSGNWSSQINSRAAQQEFLPLSLSGRPSRSFRYALASLALLVMTSGCQTIHPFRNSVRQKASVLRDWTHSGLDAMQNGKLSQARSFFKRAASQSPHDVIARVNLARADARLGNVAAATEHMRSALELNPDEPDLYVELGELYFQDSQLTDCLLYTSPSPRDKRQSRMPSSA